MSAQAIAAKLGFAVEMRDDRPVIVGAGGTAKGDTTHARLWIEVVTLTTQRDELLAVLRDVIAGDKEAIDEAAAIGMPIPDELLSTYRKSCALIASIEGAKP